jgi:N-acetylglucosamine-6-phosphate deacetylase
MAQQKGASGAQLLGCHLEGPFLNLGMKGAQKAEYIRLPNIIELREYINAGNGCIKMMSMAPELMGALEVIKIAREKGIVVSLAHSDASITEVEEASRAGLDHVTHAFNAMAGLHHRDPGTAGAILSMKQLTVDVIPDGYHVHPSVVKILVRSKGVEQVSAISDCIKAGGLGDGEYEAGGQKVIVKNGMAHLADGTLAGSTITLAEGVKVMVEKVGISLEEAIRMVSVNPARILGLYDRGALEYGKRADIVVLDHHFNVLMTIVEGKIVNK